MVVIMNLNITRLQLRDIDRSVKILNNNPNKTLKAIKSINRHMKNYTNKWVDNDYKKVKPVTSIDINSISKDFI